MVSGKVADKNFEMKNIMSVKFLKELKDFVDKGACNPRRINGRADLQLDCGRQLLGAMEKYDTIGLTTVALAFM